MKKRLLKFLLSIAAMAISINANAESFTVDGISYTVLSNYDRTVEVSSVSMSKFESGDVVIPEKVIGDKPYTVVAIGEKACYVYYNRTEHLKLKSITLPNTVTTIGRNAFYGCKNLFSVNWGNSVTTIEDSAFFNCGFTSIELPNSLTTIGDHAFNYCRNLTSISLPSVTTIGYGAFMECDKLTSISLSNSLTTIGEYAFMECSNLTSLNIPSSVMEIGDGIFKGCQNLVSLTVEDGNKYFRVIDNVLYDKDLTKLIAGCNISSVVVPNTVETIASYAFYNYGNLTSVEFQSPSSLTTIGDQAFSQSGLRSIELPNSLTDFGNALYYCENLLYVKLGNSSVTRIGNDAFHGCKSLVSIELPSTVGTIMWDAFWGCKSLTEFICYALTPPNVLSDAIPKEVYKNAVLKVPAEALESYKMTDPWDDFWVYDVIQTSGIDDVTADGGWSVTVEGGTIYISGLDGITPIEIYSVTGQCAYRGTSTEISNLPKGIYIIRIGSVAKKIAL